MPRVMYGNSKQELFRRGCDKVVTFCRVNNLPVPAMTEVPACDWHVAACAYYRPDTESVRKWTRPGINICLAKCAGPATDEQFRNWNWPGSVVDREPYGVMCHELGHHADWHTGNKKWSQGTEKR